MQFPNVETGQLVADRITAHRWLTPEQTIITSSCGFNHLPRHIALGKLKAMSEAKAILMGGGVSRCPILSARGDYEERLRASEERLRLGEIAGGIATFEYEYDSGAWNWSAQAAAIFGLDREKLDQWDKAVFVDDVQKIRAAVEAAKPGRELLRGISRQAP